MNQFARARQILPYDGEAYYFSPGVISLPDNLQEMLLQLDLWKNDEGVIFGKKYITDRKVLWVADEAFDYSYSQKSRIAQPWPDFIYDIKLKLDKLCGVTFNSCLGNLYHNGNESMGWHADNEKCMKKGAAIASLSIGADRRFSFKHKGTKQTANVLLENGSVLIMQGATQENWLHALPKSTKTQQPRVNLTFRVFEKV